MIIKIAFILVGLVIGILQYGLIKTATKYAAEKRSGVLGIAGIKLLLYIVPATAVFLWFKDSIFLFATGLAAGLILSAVTDGLRNKK